MRRPLFVTREKEWELIQQLTSQVDHSEFDPKDTALLMVSPDYSATVAMHVAHAWSKDGHMLDVIPIDVTYPGESDQSYREKFRYDMAHRINDYKHFVLVEAGIIRGGNWTWLIEEFDKLKISRDQLTLVTLYENIHSKVQSDYVAEYYNDDTEDLTFYFERFNKHWV